MLLGKGDLILAIAMVRVAAILNLAGAMGQLEVGLKQARAMLKCQRSRRELLPVQTGKEQGVLCE